jgi:hypothetical protein
MIRKVVKAAIEMELVRKCKNGALSYWSFGDCCHLLSAEFFFKG